MQKKKKMNLDTDLIPFTKITSKWIIGLRVNCKIIKLLDGNIGENLDTTPKSWPIKEKSWYNRLLKLKTSALQKTTTTTKNC